NFAVALLRCLLSDPPLWRLGRSRFGEYRTSAAWLGPPPGSAGTVCRGLPFRSIVSGLPAALPPQFLSYSVRLTSARSPLLDFPAAQSSSESTSPAAPLPAPASRPDSSAGAARHPAKAGKAPAPPVPRRGWRITPPRERLGQSRAVSDRCRPWPAHPRTRSASDKTALPRNTPVAPVLGAGIHRRDGATFA